MKINFKQFKVYTDITQTKTKEQDMRLSFADTMYKNCNGIMAHDLAMRIYKSEGEVEFTPDEIAFLKDFLSNATPIFVDSFDNNIKE